jgi:hypothetical protein
VHDVPPLGWQLRSWVFLEEGGSGQYLVGVVPFGKNSATPLGLADAGTHLGKVATVIEKGISKGATKAATAANKWGWHKLAGLFLKVAAAAPLAAKILVGVAVVAVAVTIYYVIRGA